ncbi:MAG: class I SAM-dependent methyltransferase [Merismopedia sp. SIO2A8]|nr:class I SAM-dependent methyltransferase [Merismopedia sp. SIO2A8]
MFEEKPQSLQQQVADLSSQAVQSGQPTSWFEPLYQEAQGDTTKIPWAKLAPHPYLQDWLTSHFAQKDTSQEQAKRALVIGCGLGDDAEALAKLGFQVAAFDIAPTAIAWCHQRFPESPVEYAVADLFELPNHWHHAFDLVVEIRDIQALPLNVRANAIRAVAETVAPQGQLFLVTRIRPTLTPPDGPPWPLTEDELAQFQQWGLEERDRTRYTVSEQPAITQVRLVYQRNTSPGRSG